VAGAERVRAARAIEACGEYEAFLKFVEARNQHGTGNGIVGLRLRKLQYYAQIAGERTGRYVFAKLHISSVSQSPAHTDSEMIKHYGC